MHNLPVLGQQIGSHNFHSLSQGGGCRLKS